MKTRALHSKRRAQGGVIMVITLIALVILMIGGVALIRSFDTSTLIAGNLAFKRDLVNQGELGITTAISKLTALTETERQSDQATVNYSAAQLASNAVSGLPSILLSSDPDCAVAPATGSADFDTTNGARIRYLIDRQCTVTGAFSTDNCMGSDTSLKSKGGDKTQKVGASSRPVYRVSVRVCGPRNTRVFLQSTFSL